MIVLDIGHSYIKTYNSINHQYHKIDVNDLNEFRIYLKQYQDQQFYIGNVNLSFKDKLEDLLKETKVKYTYITHDDFKPFVKLDSQLDLYEIGLDILSIVYFVNDTNYIFINNGTALLYIKYSSQLDGVIISNNVLYNTDQLLMKTNLKNHYQDIYDFGKNTSDAISAGITFSFKQTLKYLVDKTNLKKIYLNGIDKQYLNNLEELEMINCENTTLNGYIKLINQIQK